MKACSSDREGAGTEDTDTDTDTDKDTDKDTEPDPPPCLGEAAAVRGHAFATLQEAIDAATNGDIVFVCPGTWGAVAISTALELRGVGDRDTVILDAKGKGPVVHLN